MPNSQLQERVEALEVRLMHLEAALDEITQTLLDQATRQQQQMAAIRQLESLLRSLADSGKTDPLQEPPPPHY